jgi:protein-S-isoprenylcysteine O-methyltransferase Ste14
MEIRIPKTREIRSLQTKSSMQRPPPIPDLQKSAPDVSRQRARQKAVLTALAVLLVVMGLLVLFVLERMPAPLRMLVGLGDLFAGLVLLVLVRQKFTR